MAIQWDVHLDTLGLFCPMPIIKTSKKIKELTVGQVLQVVSDDEGSRKTCRPGAKPRGMSTWVWRKRSREYHSLQDVCEENK